MYCLEVMAVLNNQYTQKNIYVVEEASTTWIFSVYIVKAGLV